MLFIDFKRSLCSFKENEGAANQYNNNNDTKIMRCSEYNKKETINYHRDENTSSREGGKISSNQYSRDNEFNQVED